MEMCNEIQMSAHGGLGADRAGAQEGSGGAGPTAAAIVRLQVMEDTNQTLHQRLILPGARPKWSV